MADFFSESVKQAKLESQYAIGNNRSGQDPRVVALFEIGLNQTQVQDIVARWQNGEQVDLNQYVPLHKA